MINIDFLAILNSKFVSNTMVFSKGLCVLCLFAVAPDQISVFHGAPKIGKCPEVSICIPFSLLCVCMCLKTTSMVLLSLTFLWVKFLERFQLRAFHEVAVRW